MIELAHHASPTVCPGSVVFVPLGSTEQHGPHLPLHTDTVIASAVATGLAEELSTNDQIAYVTPALAFGASGEHQMFSGTISIGLEALETVVTELVRSLSSWSSRVVLVNGHGGNVVALARAVERVTAEGHTVTWVPCVVPGGDAHAGHVETSIMLHLAPELVDLSRASVGNTTALSELIDELRTRGVSAVSPIGVLGDPTDASASEGFHLLQTMIRLARHAIATGDPGHAYAGGVKAVNLEVDASQDDRARRLPGNRGRISDD